MDPVSVFKALGDKTRLQIMLLLASEDELCVCELVTALDQLQPKISRHIRLLKDARLISDRRQGQWMFYRWADDLPAWLCTTLTDLHAEHAAAVQSSLTNLASMQSRPERCC